MQNLKNISIGFLLSFLGSIPLGYLNVVGFQLYQSSGLFPTLLYLFGVISIELIVIYFTLIFAKRLAANKKLSKFIQLFSIVFLFLLSILFYFGSDSKSNNSHTFSYSPFILGIVLSSLNFVHIPFWTAWNLYLLNEKYIEISGVRKYFYVFGAIVGTFCGMLLLILSLNYFATNVDFVSRYLMKFIIPSLFLILGLFQLVKFIRNKKKLE